ncbi:Uncharacterized protein Fot_24237 [Forsythia ovata]|uniref:Uncharacterized protein n=1 Tax=Forsythia ovata TaxID=205694 RepID=A0ABD1U5N8_9LAMI
MEFFAQEMDQSIQDCGSQIVTKISQPRAKLQSRRSKKSASSQSHEPQQSEFQFMPTLGIIEQHNIGPDAVVPVNDLMQLCLEMICRRTSRLTIWWMICNSWNMNNN